MASFEPSNGRPAWLVLGAEPIAAQLRGLVPEIDVRTLAGSALEQALTYVRPRVVVVGTPPADRAEILAVATERLRRRSTLRAVVLTAPEDVAGRLAALEQGYDDALPATIDASELAVRLRRLSAGTQRSAGRTAIPICDGVELDGFDSPG